MHGEHLCRKVGKRESKIWRRVYSVLESSQFNLNCNHSERERDREIFAVVLGPTGFKPRIFKGQIQTCIAYIPSAF